MNRPAFRHTVMLFALVVFGALVWIKLLAPEQETTTSERGANAQPEDDRMDDGIISHPSKTDTTTRGSQEQLADNSIGSPQDVMSRRNEAASADPRVRPFTKEIAKNGDSELTAGVDNSVAGRPFPISPSIVHGCRSQVPEHSECPSLMRFLQAHANEARDVAWSTKVEGQLKAFIDRASVNGVVLRSLECRTTRCVVEVESPRQFFLGEIENDPRLANELLPDMGALGFEKSSSGEELVVTILTYSRL